jgi:hypothetical protein
MGKAISAMAVGLVRGTGGEHLHLSLARYSRRPGATTFRRTTTKNVKTPAKSIVVAQPATRPRTPQIRNRILQHSEIGDRLNAMGHQLPHRLVAIVAALPSIGDTERPQGRGRRLPATKVRRFQAWVLLLCPPNTRHCARYQNKLKRYKRSFIVIVSRCRPKKPRAERRGLTILYSETARLSRPKSDKGRSRMRAGDTDSSARHIACGQRAPSKHRAL